MLEVMQLWLVIIPPNLIYFSYYGGGKRTVADKATISDFLWDLQTLKGGNNMASSRLFGFITPVWLSSQHRNILIITGIYSSSQSHPPKYKVEMVTGYSLIILQWVFAKEMEP